MDTELIIKTRKIRIKIALSHYIEKFLPNSRKKSIMAAFLFNFFLISERDIFWNSSILIYIKLIKKNFEYFNHILNNLNNILKYMDVKNNFQIFKMQALNNDKYYTSQSYYNCSKCSYHTSNTFNFTKHFNIINYIL